MEVYVVLRWFYEGDSYLVNKYVGVKISRADALKLIPNNAIILKNNEFEEYGDGHGNEKPIEWGHYGSGPKYEIRPENI